MSDLFYTPPHELHRTTDPDTSAEAANSIDPTKSEKRCYSLCAESGEKGITNSEAAAALNKLPNATSPRWRPLARKNLIVDSGERRKSLVTNRREIVWKIFNQ